LPLVTDPPDPLRVRRLAVRISAATFALSWLTFPGFGVPDLLVSWNPEWAVVLEAGWGLFSAIVVASAFVVLAFRPERPGPALVQLSMAVAALVVSAAAGGEAPLLPLAAGLAVQTALAIGLAARLPGREAVRPVGLAPSLPLLVLAVLGAVPWCAYAAAMYSANRAESPVDVSVGIDHFAVQGALALALVALVALAAVWPRGRRQLGLTAGVAAAYLGLVSLAWPGQPGQLGQTWSILALAWGLAVASAAVAGPRLQPRQLGGEVVEAQ
jgi:hypothetical protein